jgi:putative sigma-54 modulation protein
MNITIEPKGMELTEALRAYAEEKFSMLEKFGDIVKIDVDLGMTSGHHTKGEVYVCEAHVFLPGKDFFVQREEEDLYRAIDKVKDHLKNELAEWKDRHLSKRDREMS